MMLSPQLEQVLPFLIERWLPVNLDISEVITKKLATTISSDSMSMETVRELRQDPALFAWCLAEKPVRIAPPGADATERIHLHLLKRLEHLVRKNPFSDSPFRLEDASLMHQELLHRSLTSIATSAVLAPYFKVDGELACSVSALRDAGRSLIAWNYPRTFSRAIEHAELSEAPDDQYYRLIDIWIGKLLGFTPFLLSQALAENSALPEEILIGLGKPVDHAGTRTDSVALGTTLKRISSFSEIFSLATLPGAKTFHVQQWRDCEKDLIPLIGLNGMTLLASSAEHILKRYQKVLLEINARLPQGLVTENLLPSSQQLALYNRNLHIPLCTHELQEALRSIYYQISENAGKEQIINQVMSIAKQIAGFKHGVLYFADRESFSLTPQHFAGDPGSVGQTLSCRGEPGISHPAVACFLGKSPVTETRHDEHFNSLAGIIGTNQRAGVLYLAYTTNEEDGKRMRPRPHFKALQQTLADCLGLF